MADYNPILDAETDPEAGLRSSLFKRLAANPIAIAEGAVGAPRVEALANDKPLIFKADMSGTGYTSFTGLPSSMSAIRLQMGIGSASGAGPVIAFSTDGGVNYGADQSLTVTLPATAFYLDFIIDMTTGQIYGMYFSTGWSATYPTPASITIPSGVDAIRFRNPVSRAGHVVLNVIGGIA